MVLSALAVMWCHEMQLMVLEAQQTKWTVSGRCLRAKAIFDRSFVSSVLSRSW